MSEDKYAERKAGQRKVSLKGARCSRCGAKTHLERHHTDYGDGGENVIILCEHCHEKLHISQGTWGKMKRKPKGKKT